MFAVYSFRAARARCRNVTTLTNARSGFGPIRERGAVCVCGGRSLDCRCGEADAQLFVDVGGKFRDIATQNIRSAATETG